MKRLILVLAALRLSSVPPPAPAAADDGVWANPGGMYKNGSSRKIDSQILFPREYDFPKKLRISFPGRPIFIQFVPGEVISGCLDGLALASAAVVAVVVAAVGGPTT